MNAIAKIDYTALSTFRVSEETAREIANLKYEIEGIHEVTDENFKSANNVIAKATKLSRAIDKDAKALRDPLNQASKAIKAAADAETDRLRDTIRPVASMLGDYARQKEAERRAAEAEARRIEAERRAAEAERARLEAEARRQQLEEERRAREAEQRRVEAERRAAEAEQRRIEAERRAAESAKFDAENRARIEAERRAAEAEAEAARLEAERRAAEVAAAEPIAPPIIIPEPAPVAEVIVPEKLKSAVHVRTNKVLVIDDESAIPLHSPSGRLLWKTVDKSALKAALEAGEDIPGARIEIQETAVVR